MAKIITKPQNNTAENKFSFSLLFDNSDKCELQKQNVHSFTFEYDNGENAARITSLTDSLSDIGFTADNRDDDIAEAISNRKKFIEDLYKCHFTVVTYKNMSEQKFSALRTGYDIIFDLIPQSECKDNYYSAIVACDSRSGCCFRDFAENKPNNVSMYPFFTFNTVDTGLKMGDTIYIKSFEYFESLADALAACDKKLALNTIAGYYTNEKIDINILDNYKAILSPEAIEFIENYDKGIAPVNNIKRTIPDHPIIKKASEELIGELNAKFEAGKKRVLESESEWTLKEGCKIIYVSADGDDNNDGLTEQAPKKTPILLDNTLLNHGDVVLFKRGDVWHSNIKMVQGVTYSAYGTGNKPEIRGSIDGAGKGKWTKVNDSGLYKFNAAITPDENVGNIVFDNGAYYGARVIKDLQKDVRIPCGDRGVTSNGVEYWVNSAEPMKGTEVLRHDLEYYHDIDNEVLYLLSLYGDPSERFEMIEICKRGSIIVGQASDCTVDNLCIRFTGSHGVGVGTCKNFTVRNCEVGWIGGSTQFLRKDKPLSRYGNAIEIFGGCDGYKVYNNYVYECFDCGPTVQWQGSLSVGRTVIENDIEIYDNVIEKCNSPLEVWCTTQQCDVSRFAVLANINLHDNLCRGSGYGFGGYTHQKSDYNAFYGGGKTKAVYNNAIMENNSMWDLRKYLQKAVPTHTSNTMGFNWRNNIIIKELEGPLALLGSSPETGSGDFMYYSYNDKTLRYLMEIGAFGDNDYYYTEPKAPSIKY